MAYEGPPRVEPIERSDGHVQGYHVGSTGDSGPSPENAAKGAALKGPTAGLAADDTSDPFTSSEEEKLAHFEATGTYDFGDGIPVPAHYHDNSSGRYQEEMLHGWKEREIADGTDGSGRGGVVADDAIVDWSTVDPGARVGPGTVLRGCSILDNARVNGGTLDRTLVADDAVVTDTDASMSEFTGNARVSGTTASWLRVSEYGVVEDSDADSVPLDGNHSFVTVSERAQVRGAKVRGESIVTDDAQVNGGNIGAVKVSGTAILTNTDASMSEFADNARVTDSTVRLALVKDNAALDRCQVRGRHALVSQSTNPEFTRPGPVLLSGNSHAKDATLLDSTELSGSARVSGGELEGCVVSDEASLDRVRAQQSDFRGKAVVIDSIATRANVGDNTKVLESVLAGEGRGVKVSDSARVVSATIKGVSTISEESIISGGRLAYCRTKGHAIVKDTDASMSDFSGWARTENSIVHRVSVEDSAVLRCELTGGRDHLRVTRDMSDRKMDESGISGLGTVGR